MPNAPGPTEAAILAELLPAFRVRHAECRGGSLRILEGGNEDSGPPLVLIHGRGSALVTWAAILPALAERRRVCAVDLPGFGASQGYRFSGRDAKEGIAFFVDPIEAWIEAEGLSAPVIIGHSLGGFVAIELALRGLTLPRALVLIAPMGTGPEAKLAARLFFRLWPERLARALGRDGFGFVIGAKGPREAALTHELHAVPEGRLDACRAFDALVPLYGPAPNRRDRLGSITTPVLVIGGEHDPAFPAPLIIAASAAIPKSRLCIEPTGHSPHTEMPARVLARVEAFLADLPA